MAKFNKQIIPVLILALLVGLLILYYQWQYKEKETIAPAEESQGEKVESEEEREKEVFQISRQDIMDYIADNIAHLSPAAPVMGGRWHVNRFWFTSERDVYVEYEDGHILRQILVSVEDLDGEPEYKVTAYFEPGENQWVLKEGEDTQFGKGADLYVYDEGTGEWVKEN